MRRSLVLLMVVSGAAVGCARFLAPPAQRPEPVVDEGAQARERQRAAAEETEREAAVRQKLELEVTEVTGPPLAQGFTAREAAAVARLDVRPAGDGYAAQVAFTGPVRRPFAGGTLECTLVAAPGSVPVAAAPPPGTKVRVAAAVQSCAVSEPRPARFRIADRVLAAELRSFTPVGGAFVEIDNLTSKPVTLSSATMTYFDQVASRPKLSTEIPPHAGQTVTFSTAFHQQVALPLDGAAADPTYTFGLAFTYATGGAAVETLSGNDRIRVLEDARMARSVR
jgi:hypothetical protein